MLEDAEEGDMTEPGEWLARCCCCCRARSGDGSIVRDTGLTLNVTVLVAFGRASGSTGTLEDVVGRSGDVSVAILGRAVGKGRYYRLLDIGRECWRRNTTETSWMGVIVSTCDSIFHLQCDNKVCSCVRPSIGTL